MFPAECATETVNSNCFRSSALLPLSSEANSNPSSQAAAPFNYTTTSTDEASDNSNSALEDDEDDEDNNKDSDDDSADDKLIHSHHSLSMDAVGADRHSTTNQGWTTSPSYPKTLLSDTVMQHVKKEVSQPPLTTPVSEQRVPMPTPHSARPQALSSVIGFIPGQSFLRPGAPSAPPVSSIRPPVPKPRVEFSSPKTAKKRRVGSCQESIPTTSIGPSAIPVTPSGRSITPATQKVPVPKSVVRVTPVLPASLKVAHPPNSTESAEDVISATPEAGSESDSLLSQLFKKAMARVSNMIELCAPKSFLSEEDSVGPPADPLRKMSELQLLRLSEVSERELRLLFMKKHCLKVLKNLNLCLPVWGSHEASFLWHSSSILEGTNLSQLGAYALIFDDLENDVLLRLRETRQLLEPSELLSKSLNPASLALELKLESNIDNDLPTATPEQNRWPSPTVNSGENPTHSSDSRLADIAPGLLSSLICQASPLIITQCVLQLDNHRRFLDSAFQPLDDLQPVLTTYVAAQGLQSTHQPAINFLLGRSIRFRTSADLNCSSNASRGGKRKIMPAAGVQNTTAVPSVSGGAGAKSRTKKPVTKAIHDMEAEGGSSQQVKCNSSSVSNCFDGS